MARYEFGGVMAAWLVSSVPADDVFGPGTQALTLPLAETTLEIYDAPDGGGTLVTDLLDEAGNPVSAITIPAEEPYIPRFSGPDEVTILWVQAANGRWLPIPAYAPAAGGTGGGGTDPGAVQLAGGNISTLTDAASQFMRLDIQGSEGSSPNRWEIRYYDESTSQYRPGLHANEKGLLRVRGVTPDDVPARLMAHPNLDPQWPVMEVTGDNSQDDGQKIFQVFESRVVARRDLHATVVVGPTGEALYWGSQDPATSPLYADRRPQIGDAWIDYNDPNGGA